MKEARLVLSFPSHESAVLVNQPILLHTADYIHTEGLSHPQTNSSSGAAHFWLHRWDVETQGGEALGMTPSHLKVSYAPQS